MEYNLNSKQRKTLESIFQTPTRSDILWADIESLFISLGANVKEGNGSRVRVALNKNRAVFHEPHPEKNVCKCAVNSVKDFLINAGVTPDG
jgi:hypothetical protein